jgi:hypothetical protein
MFLRMMAHQYGRRFADQIRSEVNRRLRAQGRRDWPITN